MQQYLEAGKVVTTHGVLLRHCLRNATSPKGRGKSLTATFLALPLGELSPQVTERARMLHRSILNKQAIHHLFVKKLPPRGSWQCRRH